MVSWLKILAHFLPKVGYDSHAQKAAGRAAFFRDCQLSRGTRERGSAFLSHACSGVPVREKAHAVKLDRVRPCKATTVIQVCSFCTYQTPGWTQIMEPKCGRFIFISPHFCVFSSKISRYRHIITSGSRVTRGYRFTQQHIYLQVLTYALRYRCGSVLAKALCLTKGRNAG